MEVMKWILVKLFQVVTDKRQSLEEPCHYLFWLSTSGRIIHDPVFLHVAWGMSPVNHEAPGGDFRSDQLGRWPSGGEG